MIVRKIENISPNDVTVVLSDGNSINMRSGSVLEDIDVANISGLRGLVKVTEDLGEIKPNGGRIYLKD